MSVVLGGPYNSRSYVIGCYVLYVTHARCPQFFYQLIPMKTESWKDWLRKICLEENWNFEDLKREKVLTWREESYSGGPKVLLGGLPCLLEYLRDKYGVSRDLTPEQVDELIEQSTEHWKELEEEEAKNKGSGGNISIVGAGSNEAVSFLLYALMTTKTPVIRSGIKIKLFEAHDDRQEQLKKNFDRMSTVESNINICIVDDLSEVLKNCDLLIFLGDKFRTTGMDIEKFLYLEKVLYGSYGFLCNYHMEEQTKVIFACMENAAFNATCFLADAPAVDKKKVVALTSYLGTELKLYISKMAGFPVESLEQIPVWGMADTCHLVDVDMGSLVFRIPDRYNPKFPNIKALANLIEDETLRMHLYKMWKMQQDKCVAEWRWSKIKENLEIEEIKASLRNSRINKLNTLARCYKDMEKICGRIPYWSLWDKAMAEAQGIEDYYSPENMYRRFRKGLYQVVQDNRYFENEEKKTTNKIENEYAKLSEKAEVLIDYMDPLNIGIIDTDSIRKFLLEEFYKKELKIIEDDDLDEVCNETEIPEDVRGIEILRREVYNKRNELKKKIRSYWKRHMEEEIARLENELRRKSLAYKEEGTLEEEWMAEENFSKVEVLSEKESSNTIKSIPERNTEYNYRSMFYGGEERLEETVPQEIELSEREVLNRMIKDYFRMKMKLEQKVKQDLEKESEPAESYSYEEIDDYEIRELGFITRSMKNLWNFIGVCKNAVRKKIGQDPYIAQVHELIRVLKIWFFDPYMASETVFLGIASDYDVYPFLTDTVMSQPAFCDENFRWQPLKEAEHLWPKAPHEKIPDNAETDVPFFRTPREGLPFTIQYVIGTSLECLMHFSIPPASYFQTQRKVLEYADQKEFFDLAFKMRETDKAQLKDLFRRMGQEVESSVEDFVVEEEEAGETEEQEEAEVEFESNFETVGEEREEMEEINAEMELEEELSEEENEPLSVSKPEPSEEKPGVPVEDRIEELDKLGVEETESLSEDRLDYERGEDFGSIEEFKDIEDEDDPLSFLRGYEDLTEEEFLALFEKQKDPEKERLRKSKMKSSKRTKSLWKCYLEKIGFYNLDTPDIYLEVEEEEVAQADDNQKVGLMDEEKPGNPFVTENAEDEVAEEISKEEGSEEMSEETVRQKLQQKTEDPEYLMRGIGFIENIERDFSPKNLTEMPFYDHFNSRIGVDIAEKGIHETHTEKVGFPIAAKGKSKEDFSMELMKMDVGKELFFSGTFRGVSLDYFKYYFEEKETLQVPSKPREVRGSYRKKMISQGLAPGIFTMALPPYDDSEGGSSDSFIPDDSICNSLAISGTFADGNPAQKEDPILELFKRENKKQEEILLREKESSDDECPSEPLQQNIDYYQDGLPRESVTQEEKPKSDWVHELVEEFNSPKKIGALDRASCLASLTSAYHLIKEKQRINAQNNTNISKSIEKESNDEETNEERHYREAWIKGFEKLRRIMELEKISGNSYLHLELDEEKARLKVEVAHKKEARFASWVDTVIDEHERIKDVHNVSKTGEYDTYSNQWSNENFSNPKQAELTTKTKDHRIWINQMIREIIVVDQIYNLEKVIQSVRLLSQKRPVSDDILKDVVSAEPSRRKSIRFSILEEMGNIFKTNTGELDSEEENLEPSDEDIPKAEEEMHGLPREREVILKELLKTEKEITKDCHDLASYVQKCRDNTKLYSLYRGDTPQKWKFLNRQPNESKLRYKYKALIHIMLTMAKLQEEFQKEMEELQEQEMDFTKILSDSIGEEELKKYGFGPNGKLKSTASLNNTP